MPMIQHSDTTCCWYNIMTQHADDTTCRWYNVMIQHADDTTYPWYNRPKILDRGRTDPPIIKPSQTPPVKLRVCFSDLSSTAHRGRPSPRRECEQRREGWSLETRWVEEHMWRWLGSRRRQCRLPSTRIPVRWYKYVVVWLINYYIMNERIMNERMNEQILHCDTATEGYVSNDFFRHSLDDSPATYLNW